MDWHPTEADLEWMERAEKAEARIKVLEEREIGLTAALLWAGNQLGLNFDEVLDQTQWVISKAKSRDSLCAPMRGSLLTKAMQEAAIGGDLDV